ncbi:glutathione S-transferase family protein [Burkholderia sp. Ac-20379]|uniref:glutathione S-transferase family protein n=1 Tax=Burkholderia sp. Ac-20379 TaxID=2703900 RepID=UPI001981C357|nr:glutathione S-transferase family protein [Burkholderia sp. Ac-20379]MBN3728782.1 glutathione S-transferase family protein [Burkholderia sp. Ac-20379]
MQLIIGDKNYSSWSMRPWVLMRHFGIAFDETLIELRTPDTDRRIRAVSPSGKVPCLIDDAGHAIWDSLAIAETLAERHPAQALWPADPAARARARCVSAEMHSGFMAMRSEMPLDIRAALPGRKLSAAALADVARVDALWRDCLAASGGPFLFGAFTIADAMYAPVVLRFVTYAPPLSEIAAGYVERMLAEPAVAAWVGDARRETRVFD